MHETTEMVRRLVGHTSGGSSPKLALLLVRVGAEQIVHRPLQVREPGIGCRGLCCSLLLPCRQVLCCRQGLPSRVMNAVHPVREVIHVPVVFLTSVVVVARVPGRLGVTQP